MIQYGATLALAGFWWAQERAYAPKHHVGTCPTCRRVVRQRLERWVGTQQVDAYVQASVRRLRDLPSWIAA